MTGTIHPTASIASGVRLAAGVTIAPYAVIMGDVEIGEDTWIGPHVTIGTPAQFANRKFELVGEQCSGVRIGARVVLREYVTVHQPSRDVTIVEDDAYLMSYAHVSHDTRLRRGAVLANSVQIGGFTDVGEYANVGLSSVLHQFTTIGAFAMVGMGSIVSKDVPPFVKAYGNPMQVAGVNTVGLGRAGIDEAAVAQVNAWYASGEPLTDPVVARLLAAYDARRKEAHRAELALPRATR
jgi:UDP-N-acetylglucosamine acyltransferase